MTTPSKVVGKAVALKRGHYPRPDGVVRIVSEGETFDLIDGKTKALWFKALPPEKKKQADLA